MRSATVVVPPVLFHFLWLAATACPALAGDVTGRVVIEPAPVARPAPARKPPPVAPSVTAPPPPEPWAIVYVESIEAPPASFAWPAELESARIEMDSLAFRPRQVVVRAGGAVAFENADDLFHQPFSCSRGNRFDLGRYRKGEAPTVTFAEPGVARVYCEVHAGMRAFVLVARNPFVAVAEPDGSFRIPDVPPGRHRLAVVFEGDVLDRREIDVSDGDAPPAFEWRVASGAMAPETERGEKAETAAAPAPCCESDAPRLARR